MKIRIWGARGSHPHPITPDQFRERVKSIVQRVREEDISSNENRERFLNSLPDWLWNPPGGNTPCVEVRLSDGSCLIFDAGTGIIPLSQRMRSQEPGIQDFHLFFSHFHYDHIQGLPFFSQAYNPSTSIHFYSPEPDVEYNLKDHMQHPFFPVTMEEKMTGKQHFHVLRSDHRGNRAIELNGAKVEWHDINHPGNAYAYRITEGDASVIIATDYELSDSDFAKQSRHGTFFANPDVLILDTMYTLGEAIEKFNWGHSSFSIGVDFAHAWGVKTLLMFHHEPQYSDKRLYNNLRHARWYAERQNYPDLDIRLAQEGMEIDIP
ncbi:MBL fold metallo-hydrolase [Salinispira pacifica]|uniref:Metallo-beta-lactamase domain-containing protein n=1 Tax=Salinispira pacifica TaxID=1307761 RepID=V5WH73_9SPIO|nr:MBL fold metallo-hydrolase [Salinispira pacifica]AHC15143.1 hypothetical protein L21SP2_1766 [Salinispira pacifica]